MCEKKQAVIFPLPPYQQAMVVSDPNGMLLSEKEIKFSAPRFPKVTMQRLFKTVPKKKKKLYVLMHARNRCLPLIECMYLATGEDTMYCATADQMASQGDSAIDTNMLGTSLG